MSGPTASDPRRRAELAAIHAAKRSLALEDDSYRGLLERLTGKRSAADLDAAGRARVIEEFRRLGFRRPAKAGAAPSRQQRKVLALWRALYNLGALDHGDGRALEAWLERTAGASALRFLLRADDANKAIEGLKAMAARVGFHEPNATEVLQLNGWRKAAGLKPAEPGLAAKARLIELQWQRLIEAGAMRAGNLANLETWLSREGGVTRPDFLAAATADRCIEKLGAWIRRVGPASKGGE